MKIVKSLKESGLLIKMLIKKEGKEKKVGLLGTLLGILSEIY